MYLSSLFRRSMSSLLSAILMLAVGVAMMFHSVRDSAKLRYVPREFAAYSKPVNVTIASTDVYTSGKVEDLSNYRSVYRRSRTVQLKPVV